MPRTTPLFGGEVDLFWVELGQPNFTPRKPGYNEWGYTNLHTEVKNNGMPADLPIATWDMLPGYKWPDPYDEARYAPLAERLENPRAEGRYVHMGWFIGLFDTVYRLHWFEDCMMDFHLEPEKMHYITGKVAEFMLAVIDTIAKKFPGRIHGLLLPDDWGGQTSTFMSVEMWDDFFGRHYREIGKHLHDAGIHFWLHSDGRINDLLPVLIDCGLDCINMPSPTVVGIDDIANRFAGKLCFSNGVDIQSTLVTGTDAEIEDEARQLCAKWHTPKGGFIPGDTSNLEPIGARMHARVVAINAFRKYAYGLPPITEQEVARHKW
jgi:hypothetical protein